MHAEYDGDLDGVDVRVKVREAVEPACERVFVAQKRNWSGGARERHASRYRRKGGSLNRMGGMQSRRNKRGAF